MIWKIVIIFVKNEHYTVADESGDNYYKHTFYMNPDDELIDTDYFQYCEFYSIDNTVLILMVNNASVKDEALKKFKQLISIQQIIEGQWYENHKIFNFIDCKC